MLSKLYEGKLSLLSTVFDIPIRFVRSMPSSLILCSKCYLFLSRKSIYLCYKQQLCIIISLNFQPHQIIFGLYKMIWSDPLSEFGNFFCISSFLFIMVKHFRYKANISLCINQSHEYTGYKPLKSNLSKCSEQRKKCSESVCSYHLQNSHF